MTGPSTMRFGLRHGLSVLLAFAATGGLVGCGGSGSPGGSRASDSTARTAAPRRSEASAIHGDTVEVALDEYVIDMPDTIPAGRTVFHLRNLGFEEHDIEIRLGDTDSVVFNFQRPLNPGETRYIETSLDPGSYRVVCTVSGHEPRGMNVALVVAGNSGEH